MRITRYAIPIAMVVWFAVLFQSERKRPLRVPTEPKVQHIGRNLAVAAATAITLALSETPLLKLLTKSVAKNKSGLLQRANLPRPIYLALSVVLMDYTLYIWHVLTHRIPFLWRFHVAHHIDRDLDISTALRFHFGEMAISVLWRLLQVRVLGIDKQALKLWQSLLFFSILFHHSNLPLPKNVDRFLNQFIVTPRMHGIHHSVIESETNSNWSSGLTIWDKLHGTYRMDVADKEIITGVPAFQNDDDLTLAAVLEMPFQHQPDSWCTDENKQPVRREDGQIETIEVPQLKNNQ